MFELVLKNGYSCKVDSPASLAFFYEVHSRMTPKQLAKIRKRNRRKQIKK